MAGPTTTPREQLRALLQELNFKGMARALDDELDAAEHQARPAAEVLRRLLTEQALYQRERRLAWRLLQARLPWQWTLESFPFAQQSVSGPQPASLPIAQRRASWTERFPRCTRRG